VLRRPAATSGPRRARRAAPELLERVALAHVVTGFLQRRPSLIQVAERLLACTPVRRSALSGCLTPDRVPALAWACRGRVSWYKLAHV